MEISREEMIAELCGRHRWSREQVELGIRAGFKCEYCRRDLLASVDDYDAWQVDHVFPSSRGGTQGPENKAISCKTCNFIKRNWIPNGVTPATANRDEMIAQARRYIEEQRDERRRRLARISELAGELMKLSAGG